MKTLKEIESILAKNKKHLFIKYAIKSMAIFGSYVSNEQTVDSDLDIVVEFDGKIGIRFIDLAEEIENLIGFKVDLVSRNGIKDKYYQAIKSSLIHV